MFVKQPRVQEVRLMKRVKTAKSKPIRFEEDRDLKENQYVLTVLITLSNNPLLLTVGIESFWTW